VPRYKFAWTNLSPRLLEDLARHLGLDPADSPIALQQRFSARPTDEFVRLTRPALERTWLARDPAALAAVVRGLWRPSTRDGYLPPSDRQSQLDWLASRNSTARLREVVLAQFIATGERNPDRSPPPAPRGPDPVAGEAGKLRDHKPIGSVTRSRPVKEEPTVAPRGRPRGRVTSSPPAPSTSANGTLDVKALETWLWDAACQIRGPLDAPKFKDYILPLIFLKRLSERLSH